jgi:hypothetical protein
MKLNQGTTGFGPNGGAAANSYNVAPSWNGTKKPADVSPGFNGNVGLNGFTTGGNTGVTTTTPAGVGQVEQFASSSNTASYGAASDFADSLIYQGMAAGVVTLAPFVQASGSQYWTLTTPGSTAAASTYTPKTFGQGDVINSLPVLVIDVITTGGGGGHSIVSLAATAAANATHYGSQVGSLTITGSAAAGYTVAQVTGLSSTTGNVATSAWNATTDPEIYGVDVKVNGAQATPSQLATLLAAINGTDGVSGVTATAGLAASTTDPTPGHILSSLDTGTTTYNLFLSFAGGGPSIPLDDLGLDLSNANDSNLTGYSFSAVSVVPEPMSLGLLALGGVGLMSRRSRRKA